MQRESDPKFTVKETARKLDMSAQGVYEAIWSGRLRVRPEDEFSIGAKAYRFIRLSEINRYRVEVQDKEPLKEDEVGEGLDGRLKLLAAIP